MALPEPVKRGQVHPKDYQNEEYYGKLQPLVAALAKEVPEAKYDAKGLVVMLVQILHFQEAALGRDAMPPRVCPKLPIKLITDPAVGGALHAIALKVADIRRARSLKAIEWQNPGKRQECLEVLVNLRRELERRQLLRLPRVHVSPSLGPETQRLREYVRRLQGNLAERPDEAGVTHIVYPFGPGGDPDDGNEYTTVVAVKGDKARVHYWYQPDSYDEWIPTARLDSKEVHADKAPPGGVWKVTPRWVVDSEKFNEWMNPADYTTPDFEAEIEAAQRAGGEGKRGAAGQGGTAKKARVDGSKPEVSLEPLSRLDVHVAGRRLLHPHKGLADPRGITTENISQGQTNVHLAAYTPPAAPQAPLPEDEAAAAAGYSAPACAAWFRFDAIHDHERAFCPDFFSKRSSSKTPQLFMSLRNRIIELAACHPGQPLLFAAVRQALPGQELNGLQRIYDMLCSWGIINHNTAQQPGPQQQQPNGAAALAIGHGVSGSMPPGTACLFDFKSPSRVEVAAALQQGGITHGQQQQQPGSAAAPGSLLVPAYGKRSAEVGLRPSVTAKVYCSAMPWVECSTLRYHCTKHPDINLCPAAYAEGRFPPGCSSRDFVRLEGCSRLPSSDGWRPEETLLLLEGLELYKEDWAAVAAHVGTRSQAACLAHFVRLPIEDQFVEDIADWGQPGTAAAAAPAPAAAGQSFAAAAGEQPVLPFQDEGNPVLAVVVSLAVLLGPKVASAAAQRAMQVLVEGDAAAAADLAVSARIAAGPPAPAAAAAAVNGDAAADGAAAAGVEEAAAAAEAAGNGNAANGTAEEGGQEAAAAAAANGDPPVPDPARPVSKQLMLAAVAAGLAAAAARAKQQAWAEERDMQRLMVMVADAQLRKVAAKTKLLAEMTQVIDRERAIAEASIKQLTVELPQLVEQRKKAEAAKAVQQQQAAAVAKQKAAIAQQQQQKAQAASAAAQQQKAAAGQAAAASNPAPPPPPQQQQHQQQQQQQPQPQPPQQQQQKQAGAGLPALQQLQQQQQQLLQQQAAQQQAKPPTQPQPMEEDDDDFDMP